MYGRGNDSFLSSGTGRDTGIPDAPAGTEGGQEDPSGEDSISMETSELYMEIIASKSFPLQETTVYDDLRHCRKYGTDAGGLWNPGFCFGYRQSPVCKYPAL